MRIYQVDGQLGLQELTETGEPHFVPLDPIRLIVNENRKSRSRRYRPYVSLKLPPEIALRTGNRQISVALYQTERDKRRGNPKDGGYLRSANVRLIGPSNPDFDVYKKLRADSESLNRTIEDSMYRHHRAHSDGWARQQVDNLGLAGLINALTRERMRRARLAEQA